MGNKQIGARERLRTERWDTDDALPGKGGYPVRKRNRSDRRERATRRLPVIDDAAAGGRRRPVVRRQRADRPQDFRCRHCRTFVGPVPSGGRHRNHCPVCLYSRHVDERLPGDRLSTCGGSMAPIGSFERADGEIMLLHRCMGCGVVRRNRIAADDDYALVLALPVMVPPPVEWAVAPAGHKND